MAILKALPGVEVTVQVAGEPLHEYQDPTCIDDSDTVTRYIEARHEQTFEILVVTSAGAIRGAGLQYRVVIDGNRADNTVVEPTDCSQEEPWGWLSAGFAVDGSSYREYKFKQLSAGEHGVHMASAEVEDLGVIEIEVYHLFSVSRSGAEVAIRNVPSGFDGVSEKTTKGKGLTHTIGFGDVVPKDSGDYRVNLRYMTEEPIASFRFLYRSREALKAQLIIPRTPSPPPLEERDADSLGRDDISEMQKQFKAMKEKMEAMAKVKREEQDDNPRPRKAARPLAEQEVIELD